MDDLLRVSGATLEGTVPRVAQLEADEQGVPTTWLDVAGDRPAFSRRSSFHYRPALDISS